LIEIREVLATITKKNPSPMHPATISLLIYRVEDFSRS